MPCRTDDHEPQRTNGGNSVTIASYNRMKAEADNATRMLCALMTFLERNHSGFDFTTNIEGLAEWWEAHKEVDRKRELKEVTEAVKGLSFEQLQLLKFHMKKLNW